MAAVRACLATVQRLDRDLADPQRVEVLRALEELKAAAAAAQARVTADLDAAVRARHAAAGLPPAEQGRGVAAQVALARRDSPHRGGQHLGLATALVREMPHTLAALDAGVLSEWRATLLVRETAYLSRAHRGEVDRALAGDPSTLDGLGDRALAGRARAAAYRLDPAAVTARAANAQSQRRVSLRPAPDTMAYLSGLLPVAQGVAAWAALGRAADAARAAGDPRSRGQLMADTLVERLTGQASAEAVPVTVDLVITDRSLFGGDPEPAVIPGYGPIPAGTARTLLHPHTPQSTGPHPDDSPSEGGSGVSAEAEVWLRRLYTHPSTGELVAMDSRARCFPPPLRGLLLLRDQTCRTPWCDAPVRQADHAHPHAAGGPTSAGNGQGLCEACNLAKQAPGWRARPAPHSAPGSHRIETITPTGHRYTSRPPPQPGTHPPDHPPKQPTGIEIVFADYLAGCGPAA